MHFVGNRAIILGDGSKEIQLYYNPGFTALSAVLPIIFLFCGLTTVEVRRPGQPFFWHALVVAGIVAGLAITGMHYVGNFGVSNYRLHFPAGYIIGAAAIAICASITALTLFFYFKERWINSWPRRLVCACLLAGAVSGMHWVASIGTTYTLTEAAANASSTGRDTNLIVAIVISLLSCVVCMVFALLTQRRKKQLADRAQHVVLASATFDPDGKILVTQEGLLPSQKITKQYNQRSFNDEFNVSHPVFQWLYRVTYNWSAVADLVPAMRHHLHTMGMVKDPTRPITPGSEDDYAKEESEDYSILFREHFCVAASELAQDLSTSIKDLGVLYNGIMMTGSMASEFQPRRRKMDLRKRHSNDIEAGIINPTMFGRGQLLFVVRRLDRSEAQKLMAEGYRFAHVHQVCDIIARSMQVPQGEMLMTIDRLQRHCVKLEENSLAASSYLACYAMRAAVKGGWEVLAPKGDPSSLPMVELSSEPLKPWHLKLLGRLDGLSVQQCLSYLDNKASETNALEEKEFMETVLDQIAALVAEVPEPFFGHAIFCSKPVKAPSIGAVPGDAEISTSGISIFAFCIIPDVHASSIKSTQKLTYVPLSFFRCSQRVYRNSPDHAILARKVHREFSAILSNSLASGGAAPFNRQDSISKGSFNISDHLAPRRSSNKLTKNTRKWHFSLPGTPRRLLPPSNPRNDASSENGLVDSQSVYERKSSEPSVPAAGGLPVGHVPVPFGGIMVSSDTTVEVQAKDEFMDGGNGTTTIEMMGIKTEAGQGAKEEPTYVDELFRIASARWQRS
jgi:NO-binding membrane sensor protein with MHYT domain